jgi:hypothetical protein
VNANFHATLDCHFEYVSDVAFQASEYASATQAACPSLPDGSVNTEVRLTPSTLAPSTTYHYRVVAANNAGSTTGGSQTFTTLPEAPATITAQPASAITASAAKLNGKVNSHGGTVSNCHFDYGPTLSYGSSAPCPSAVGVEDADVQEVASLTSLTSETTLHYRLSVTTNAGTVNGEDEEFTTLSPPPPPPDDPPPPTTSNPPSQPPLLLTPPTTTNPPPRRLICRRGFQKRRVHGRVRCVRKHRAHQRRTTRAHR